MDEISTNQPIEPAENTAPAQEPAASTIEPSPVANAPTTAPESQTPPVQTQPATVVSQQSPIDESPKPNFISQLLQNARKKIQERKQVRLQKILALAQSKGAVTNDDIEKLLRVSDKTAERYLSELVKQGRLKKAGSTSQVRYELLK